MNDNTRELREFALRRLTMVFRGDGTVVIDDRSAAVGWGLALGIVLLVGLLYVVWMYVRDGHSIGWVWATFLGALRLGVYAVLAAVFLLPAWQNWEETRQQSKVVLACDISRSMLDKMDDPVVEGQDPKSRPTRQDKVLAFLGEPTDPTGFFKRLEKTNPVTLYRWGSGADDDYVVVSQDGLTWERKAWEDNQHEPEAAKRVPGQPFTRDALGNFLKPDLKADAPPGATDDERKAFDTRKQKLERLTKSTNAGESILGVLSKEINNMPQGLVIFSDCRSTEGGPQAFKDLADRARRAKVPVFVVVVGEDRPETRIEITDARAPDVARPEDPFPVSVDVTGVGLNNRDVTVLLDIFRPEQDPKKDKPLKTIEKKVTFKGTQVPRVQVEFPITPAEYGEIPADTQDKPEDKPAKPGEKPAKPAKPEEKPTKPEFKVGDWKFVARVARDTAETFGDAFHVKEPVIVKVLKRPLRVLLMASAPTRDYQFVRTLMVRESDKKRLELSIYLQPLPGQLQRTGVVQDVPPDRMLKQFPDRLDDKKATEEAQYNLANYDVIIAFDPDWTQLNKDQCELVERWVSQQGGGLIVVAGPIHTLELARPGASGLKPGAGDIAKLKPILDIYPVELKDVRLEKDRNTAIPAGLAFPNATPEMEFLKLDEENEGSGLLAAWEEFFRGKKADNATGRLLRGFYGFYPVKKAKDTSITVATFKDDTSADKSEPPYLVITPTYGKGRVVWMGSGETWRLRQFREVWHERFWTKLARYASAGSMGTSSRRIAPSIGDKFPAGSYVEFEAQFFGKDLKPLPRDVQPKPKVVLRPPVGVEMATEYRMEPKAIGGGDWEGRFLARVLIKAPGKYGVDISLDEPGEPPQSKTIDVVETDAEMQNTRPDLAAAYELASDADDVLARVDDPARKQELRQALQRFKGTAAPGEKPAAGAEKEKLRLIFDLQSARLIPDCMHMVETKQQSRGKVEDLWDEGIPLERVLYWFGIATGALAGLLLFGVLGLLAMGRPVMGALIVWGMLSALCVAAVIGRAIVLGNNAATPFSIVLGIVVTLLSVEWLTRKLLRLA
jgi:hypothetical protein